MAKCFRSREQGDREQEEETYYLDRGRNPVKVFAEDAAALRDHSSHAEQSGADRAGNGGFKRRERSHESRVAGRCKNI